MVYFGARNYRTHWLDVGSEEDGRIKNDLQVSGFNNLVDSDSFWWDGKDGKEQLYWKGREEGTNIELFFGQLKFKLPLRTPSRSLDNGWCESSIYRRVWVGNMNMEEINLQMIFNAMGIEIT